MRPTDKFDVRCSTFEVVVEASLLSVIVSGFSPDRFSVWIADLQIGNLFADTVRV